MRTHSWSAEKKGNQIDVDGTEEEKRTTRAQRHTLRRHHTVGFGDLVHHRLVGYETLHRLHTLSHGVHYNRIPKHHVESRIIGQSRNDERKEERPKEIRRGREIRDGTHYLRPKKSLSRSVEEYRHRRQPQKVEERRYKPQLEKHNGQSLEDKARADDKGTPHRRIKVVAKSNPSASIRRGRREIRVSIRIEMIIHTIVQSVVRRFKDTAFLVRSY